MADSLLGRPNIASLLGLLGDYDLGEVTGGLWPSTSKKLKIIHGYLQRVNSGAFDDIKEISAVATP